MTPTHRPPTQPRQMHRLRTGSVAMLLLLLLATAVSAQEFMVGADLSSLRGVLDAGGQFYDDDGSNDTALNIFQAHGFNGVRLKLWHTPDQPYNDLPRVLQTAAEAKAQGYHFLLDFHYSDTWADPGTQDKPAAWEDLEFDALVDSVYQYTYDVMATLRDADAMPDMVQVGNEINCGMLWPDGNVCGGNNTPQQWAKLAQLIGAGIDACHDAEGPDDDVEIMIHHANGHLNFFTSLITLGLEFDYVGRSYYPTWHGDINDLDGNLTQLANNLDQGVIIAEVGYMWMTGWCDNWSNVFWEDDILPGYPATPAGQVSLLNAVNNVIRTLPNDAGVGTFYWEPAWLPSDDYGSPMENAALFDCEGNALPAIDVLATDPSDLPVVNITMRFNTATVWDTLATDGVLQLRGEVIGFTGYQLPDGRNISWGEDSEVFAENVGGDYWEATVPILAGDTLSFKCWTGHDINTPTNARLGWEGPVIAGGGLDGNTRLVAPGDEDVITDMQFVNGSGVAVDQYDRPWTTDPDSVRIYYRVNAAHLMAAGEFDPDNDDWLGVVGDDPLPGGDEAFVLTREEYSVAGGSFWSGMLSVSRADLADGFEHAYRFVTGYADMITGYEDNERSLTLTADYADPDTTLHWDFYNGGGAAVGDEPLTTLVPDEHRLLTAYPNPFNGRVTLQIDLDQPGMTRAIIVNTQGRVVWVSPSQYREAGRHWMSWDGHDLHGRPVASGVYLARLQTEQGSAQRKLVMLQ